MSQLNSRQIKALQTKKKILETALNLFSEKGFDNVTVDEIVHSSGIAKGSFYTHFKSKYEIFLEKFKEIDNFYIDFTKSLPEEMSPSKKLLLLAESQMIFLRDYLGKDLVRTLYTNALTPNPHNYFLDKDRSLYKIVNKFAKEGLKKGEFKKNLLPCEITMLITRSMRGSLYDWCIHDNDFDLLIESQKLICTVLEGISEYRS